MTNFSAHDVMSCAYTLIANSFRPIKRQGLHHPLYKAIYHLEYFSEFTHLLIRQGNSMPLQYIMLLPNSTTYKLMQVLENTCKQVFTYNDQ